MKGEWTRERVEQHLLEAADVLRRLPEQRIQGYFSLWPRIAHEFADLVGQEPQRLRRPPPLPDAIDRMEQVLPWLAWLEPDDAKLVWMRAEGTPWKVICWRFGVARATAHRRWEYTLSLITWRLSGRRAPSRRSRRYLVRRVCAAEAEL